MQIFCFYPQQSGERAGWQARVWIPTRKCWSKNLAEQQIMPRLTQRVGSKIEILASLLDTQCTVSQHWPTLRRWQSSWRKVSAASVCCFVRKSIFGDNNLFRSLMLFDQEVDPVFPSKIFSNVQESCFTHLDHAGLADGPIANDHHLHRQLDVLVPQVGDVHC